MGWYVTCEICGNEEKYGLSCDCYDKEMFEIIEKIKGFTIEDNYIFDSHIYLFLHLKLVKDDEKMYVSMVIRNEEGEYKIRRSVQLITEEEYNADLPRKTNFNDIFKNVFKFEATGGNRSIYGNNGDSDDGYQSSN